MPSLPQLPSATDDYAPPPGTVWSPATYIATIVHMAARVRAVEAVGTTLQDIIAELQVFGLQRLDEAIVPLIEEQQAALANLQTEIAAALAATQALVDDFQTATATALADLQGQIDAQLLIIEGNITALQEQVDLILAGGLSADDVVETGTRVFVSPAQKTAIDSIATTLAAATAAIDAALAANIVTVNGLLAGKEKTWSVPTVVVGDDTMTDHEHTILDSAAAVRTATLPASPAVGTAVRIQRRGANDVVVARNGQTIRGEAADFTIDTNHICLEFRFGTTWDWF
jgi:hypothetical protein